MKCLKLAAIALSLSLAGTAWADEHDVLDNEVEAMNDATPNVSDQQIEKLATQFEGLHGDETDDLFRKLRTGEAIELERDTGEVDDMDNPIFEAVTIESDGMGYGEMKIAAAMTSRLLESEQFADALGGILEARADGMGWGEIGREHGFSVGELMRDLHSNRPVREEHLRGHEVARVEHPNKPERVRPERAARPERPERPQRPERPERPEKPERPDRPGRP